MHRLRKLTATAFIHRNPIDVIVHVSIYLISFDSIAPFSLLPPTLFRPHTWSFLPSILIPFTSSRLLSSFTDAYSPPGFTPAKPTLDTNDASTSTSASNPNKLTPLHHRRSFSFSFAQPTASSVAKAAPGSPEKDKRRSILPSSSNNNPGSSSNANTSTSVKPASTSTPLNSSLSSLSLALQKLSMPVPSRPGTSLGVHTAGSEGRGVRAASVEASTSTSTPATSSARPPAPTSHPRPASVAAAAPMQRSATVGDLLFKTPAQPQPRQTTQALGSTSAARPPETKTRISVHEGLVAGKPKGKISFGRSAAAAGPSSSAGTTFRPGGFAPAGAGGSRVFARASKKTSLPVVEGSPVKPGGGAGDADGEEGEGRVNREGASLIERAVERQRGGAVSGDETKAGPSGAVGEASRSDATTAGETTDPPAHAGTTMQAPSAVPLKRDNSRRASLALRLMRDQIAHPSPQAPPHTPVASGSGSADVGAQEGPSADSAPPKRAPSAYRFNLRERPEPKSAPAALKRSASGSGAHVGRGKRVSAEGEGEGGTPERMRGVLRECTVFVDVRTDDGDDAGALFVDMLADMGAKVR